jgi:hypothetical protein
MGQEGTKSYYTQTEVDALIAAHAADLSAHIRDLREIWRTGTYMPSLLFPNDWIHDSIALVANQLEVIAYPVIRKITFDRIAIYVGAAGAAGTKARLGIYQDDGNCYPSTLVLDAGTVDVDGTGLKVIVIDQQLDKGLYWLAVISNGTPSLWGLNDSYLGIFGGISNIHLHYSAWYKASAYNGLASSFPAGATEQNHLLNIALRVLSLD